MWSLLPLACREPEPFTAPSGTGPPTVSSSPGGPAFTAAPRVTQAEASSVRLVERVEAVTDRPTRLTVTLDDGERRRTLAFADLVTRHEEPLLALLPDTAYVATATFTDERGEAVAATVPFTTGEPSDRLPDLEVRASEPDRMEPGYTVFPTEIRGKAVLAAVDAEGRVVWTYEASTAAARALSFEDGVFAALLGGAVARFAPTGETLAAWSHDGTVDGSAAIPWTLNHECAFEADGSFWSLHTAPRAVDAYPVSEDDPTVLAPATIADDRVVHVAADGTVLDDWSMVDRLDPSRIGYGAMQDDGAGFEWGHANAVVPLPDGVLVSLRHQDAVVRLSRTGELEWILGNHDGWPPELQGYLLEPTGDPFGWPYHQHAPMVDADGRITLFDNGNDHRTTPYSQQPQPGPLHSRIVQLEVDPVARTARLVFAHPGPSSPLYSQALGNADAQPLAGTILATFPFLWEEDGVKHRDEGLGARSVRIVEVDPATSDVVFDLRLTTSAADAPDGLLTDRAIRVHTLYGPEVIETWDD